MEKKMEVSSPEIKQSLGEFIQAYRADSLELHRRLFNVLGGKIHQIESCFDNGKKQEVFGWVQILSSLEAAILLFLNANIATKSFRIDSLDILEGLLSPDRKIP